MLFAFCRALAFWLNSRLAAHYAAFLFFDLQSISIVVCNGPPPWSTSRGKVADALCSCLYIIVSKWNPHHHTSVTMAVLKVPTQRGVVRSHVMATHVHRDLHGHVHAALRAFFLLTRVDEEHVPPRCTCRAPPPHCQRGALACNRAPLVPVVEVHPGHRHHRDASPTTAPGRWGRETSDIY